MFSESGAQSIRFVNVLFSSFCCALSSGHYYYEDYIDYFQQMYGLNLSDATLKKLYRDNALRMFSRGPQWRA